MCGRAGSCTRATRAGLRGMRGMEHMSRPIQPHLPFSSLDHMSSLKVQWRGGRVGEAAVAGLAADREALDAAVLVAREGRVLFLSTADRTAAVAAAVAAVVAAFPGVRSFVVGWDRRSCERSQIGRR